MDWRLLERLCNTPGIPGYEQEIGAVVAEELHPYCDSIHKDRLGNIIALKKSSNHSLHSKPRRIVIAAHMDEIGFIIKNIDEKGFITLHPVGGLHSQILISQRVFLHGKKTVRGVIAPNMSNINDQIPKLCDLRVDTGLSRQELENSIEVGDMVSLDTSVEKLNEKIYTGRNFDNRVGVYCMVEAMRRVKNLSIDAYAVGSVQEEVGVRGIGPAAYDIQPEVALAIDGSLCSGPHGDTQEGKCSLGKGAGIYLIDNLTIGDRGLVKFLFELAKQNDIPCQKNIGGGTDASGLQRARSGALVTTVGAPVRYMHSTVQICHEDDLEATIQLLVAFLESAHGLKI